MNWIEELQLEEIKKTNMELVCFLRILSEQFVQFKGKKRCWSIGGLFRHAPFCIGQIPKLLGSTLHNIKVTVILSCSPDLREYFRVDITLHKCTVRYNIIQNYKYTIQPVIKEGGCWKSDSLGTWIITCLPFQKLFLCLVWSELQMTCPSFFNGTEGSMY